MEREYWTELDGTNGLYDISNLGNIRNVHTRRNITPRKKGACVVVQLKNKSFGIKKIFIANEVFRHFNNNLKVDSFHIFHKDGNIWNNRLDNLYGSAHILNETTNEQKQVFDYKVYECVRAIVYNRYNIKGIDKEDLIQESVMLVYKYLPNYNFKCKFITFCAKYVKYAYLSNLEKLTQLRLFNEIDKRYL